MKKLLAVALCALAGCSQKGSTSTPKQAVLSPQAISQIETLLAEKDARSPVQRKISSQLLYAKYGNSLDVKGMLPSAIVPDSSGRVLVDIKGTVNADLLDGVAKLGGEVATSSIPHGSARVLIGLDQLENVAAL